MTVVRGVTSHALTDYYPQLESADSLTTTDPRLHLTAGDEGWTRFDVGCEADALASSIEVWYGGQARSIAVLAGSRAADAYMTSSGVDDGCIVVAIDAACDRCRGILAQYTSCRRADNHLGRRLAAYRPAAVGRRYRTLVDKGICRLRRRTFQRYPHTVGVRRGGREQRVARPPRLPLAGALLADDRPLLERQPRQRQQARLASGDRQGWTTMEAIWRAYGRRSTRASSTIWA